MKVYLDNSATTAMAAEVIEAMLPYFADVIGNAQSVHSFGQRAEVRGRESPLEVATLINASPSEIVFLSGGTEADNLALRGIAEAHAEHGRHIITTRIEHPAVLATCEALEVAGYRVTYLPVSSNGIVRIDDVRQAINDDTISDFSDAGQQRDRDNSAHQGDRRTCHRCSRARSGRFAPSHRRSPGSRQDPGRRQSSGHRSGFPYRVTSFMGRRASVRCTSERARAWQNCFTVGTTSAIEELRNGKRTWHRRPWESSSAGTHAPGRTMSQMRELRDHLELEVISRFPGIL